MPVPESVIRFTLLTFSLRSNSCELTNSSDLTLDKILSCSEAGRWHLWRLVLRLDKILLRKKLSSALVKRNWWQIFLQNKQKFAKCGWAFTFSPFEKKFTIFYVCWLIDFMLPCVLSVLQLPNEYNITIHLRDSNFFLQNKPFKLVIFSYFSLKRMENLSCFAALPSHALFVQFCLACIVFLLYVVLEFFVHLSWSLLSVAVKFWGKARFFSFELFSLWKRKWRGLTAGG